MSTLKAPREKITLESIEIALKQVDAKKQTLKKAFENLQAHSFLSLPSLSWFHIDSHFSSLYSNLSHRFDILQNSLQPDPCARPDSGLNSDINPIANGPEKSQNRFEPVKTPPKSVALEDASTSCERVGGELARICREMDGKRLREYVAESGKERGKLVSAMRVAPDPGLLVLEAIEGFCRSNLGSKGEKDGELFKFRKICLVLLEVVVEIRPSLSSEVRERAKMLALEWKGKVSLKGESTCEALGFLNLIAGYGLESEFDAGEFVEYLYAVARFKQAPALCKAFKLGEKTCGEIVLLCVRI